MESHDVNFKESERFLGQKMSMHLHCTYVCNINTPNAKLKTGGQSTDNSQILSPCLGDIIDSSIGLLYTGPSRQKAGGPVRLRILLKVNGYLNILQVCHSFLGYI